MCSESHFTIKRIHTRMQFILSSLENLLLCIHGSLCIRHFCFFRMLARASIHIRQAFIPRPYTLPLYTPPLYLYYLLLYFIIFSYAYCSLNRLFSSVPSRPVQWRARTRVSNRSILKVKGKVKTGYLYSGTVSLTATGGCRLFCSALPVCSA